MKKFLTLMIVLVMILTLCACGDDSSDEKNTTLASASGTVESTEGTNSSIDSTIANTKENGYVGTWVHEKTDDEPFSMNLTLNTDGTGKSGKTTGVEWCFDEAEDRISIILVYSDGEKGGTTYASLIEGNKLCWENKVNIKTSTGEILEYDRIVLEKQ